MNHKLLIPALTFAACAPAPPLIEGVSLKMNPSERAPLAAILEYSSDQPVRPVFNLSREGEEMLQITDAPFATSGPTPVLGLRAGQDYTVTISFETEGGVSSLIAEGHEISTPALPEDFPPIEVTTRRQARMEPGYQFVPAMRWTERGPDRDYGLVFALDSDGEVVWFFKTNKSVNDVKRLPNGDLIYIQGRDGRIVQINKLGEQIKHWHTTGIPKEDIPEGSIPVDADSFHHDFEFLPNGNFLALSTEAREYESYATSETDREAEKKPATVIGDVVIEFTPEGEVLRRWKLLDILDPHRISHGSLGTGFWRRIYKDLLEEPGFDWAHANAIQYDPTSDSAIISLNHQSAVVKIKLDDSSLAWILGEHGDWTAPHSAKLLSPSEGLTWPSKQHAVEITPTGSLLLFDNGGHRGPPFAPDSPAEEKYSRAVEYRVDEEAQTVEELWSYGGLDSDHFYSSFLCDVDLQPTTGNVIVTDGARVKTKGGEMGDGPGSGHHWAHIFEVDRESGRKVFEMSIEGESQWAVYRSERFSTLY